jgi:hypothetical protein
MRIGLTGGAATVDKVVEQAKRAEADGFCALWYASVVTGDPLVAMAIAGRETARIELGTAVLQTYPCHPLLQANRVASTVDAMGRAGFTLGVGPSHRPLVEGVYGYSYDHAGRNTEEYVRILAALLAGEIVDVLRCWREHRYPAVMRFLQRAAAEFAHERHATGRLGFEDLLLLAARLLREHPAVRDACVVGAPDSETGEAPIAFVVLDGGAEPGELLSFAAERLAGYKRPREVIVVDDLPRLPTGKLVRRDLRDRARARATIS